MRTFSISRMIAGWRVQLTIKLGTDEREWLNMTPDTRQAIKDRDAREASVR